MNSAHFSDEKLVIDAPLRQTTNIFNLVKHRFLIITWSSTCASYTSQPVKLGRRYLLDSRSLALKENLP